MLSIRQLTPLDAAAVRTLRLSALRESPTAFGKSYNEEIGEPLTETEKRLANNPGSVLLGAFINDALVGTLGIRRESMQKLAHKAGLWGMYVAPPHRGHGVARQLITEALAVAATFGGVRQVTLYVNAVNIGAIALYESLGFVTYGVEPCGMCVDGVFYDEHLMVNVLAAGDINATARATAQTTKQRA